MNISKLANFPRPPNRLRHKGYTYYVVAFTNPSGVRQYLTMPYAGRLGPANAVEFPNKKLAKFWMHHWMNKSPNYEKPNILKVRGIPRADRQIAELMEL